MLQGMVDDALNVRAFLTMRSPLIYFQAARSRGIQNILALRGGTLPGLSTQPRLILDRSTQGQGRMDPD